MPQDSNKTFQRADTTFYTIFRDPKDPNGRIVFGRIRRDEAISPLDLVSEEELKRRLESKSSKP